MKKHILTHRSEEKPEKAHKVWENFFTFIDNKLLDSQKKVLVLAFELKGETLTGISTQIAHITGQDSSTVRKTLIFFRKMGWITSGTKDKPCQETQFTEFGKKIACEIQFQKMEFRGEKNGN
ncbi:MAG: hypothetical protein Q7S92_06055 [Candidatus Diapherotrites archaeon]|nr:hypothetical protein [Candidatus Diapherotrites archaeon]